MLMLMSIQRKIQRGKSEDNCLNLLQNVICEITTKNFTKELGRYYILQFRSSEGDCKFFIISSGDVNAIIITPNGFCLPCNHLDQKKLHKRRGFRLERCQFLKRY